MTSGVETQTNKSRFAPWFFLVLLAVLLSTAVLLAAVPHSWAAENTLVVYQQSGYKVFGQNTSLDIFDDYLGRFGGQKLIDPYSGGTYVFAVHNNSGSDSLPYTLEIEAVNPGNVPMVVNFDKNGEFIFGGNGESNMLPFSTIQFEYTLDGNKTDIYTLRWAWNNENDVTDTQIATSGDVYYTLIITAKGVIDEAEIAPPKSGDPSNVIVWAIIMSGSTLILLIVYVRRMKKDGNSHTSFKDI